MQAWVVRNDLEIRGRAREVRLEIIFLYFSDRDRGNLGNISGRLISVPAGILTGVPCLHKSEAFLVGVDVLWLCVLAAGPSGLRPHACQMCGFESRREHRCLC